MVVNLTPLEQLLWEASVIIEGISAAGLSGGTDGGQPGPRGGSPYSGEDEDRPGLRKVVHPKATIPVKESDVLAYSGSGPTTFVDPVPKLPWQRGGPRARSRKQVESAGYFTGYPTDSTLTGLIQIKVLDNINLRVLAPGRILEQVEAYHLFEQFQILLPRTPMLNAAVMESISSWWRNFAMQGDLLEIDCTTGYASVINERTRQFYSIGHLGTAPTSSGFVD